MSYNIDKTFPDKLGDTIDINGMPFDTEALSYEKRLKRTFEKVFKDHSRKTTIKADYWKHLYEMISNPNDTFGLVAIDGYMTDVMGNDDIALVFNMGIPRLRGRTIYYLDRIYVRVSTNNELKFYNSGLEDDNVYFDWNYRVPAWHPHVQNAQPCLGSYGNELTKWKTEGNPMMYLRTIHMFLNTWNRRSPFWQLNHVAIDYTEKKKRFKASKVLNALHIEGISAEIAAKDFVINNINKVNTKSIQNDANILAIIFGKLKYIEENIGRDIHTKMDISQYRLITNIAENAIERRNSRRTMYNKGFSILNGRERTEILIPTLYEDRTSISSIKINKNKLTQNSKYDLTSQVLDAFEKLMERVYNYTRNGRMYKKVYEKSDYAIRLYCKYYAPVLTRNLNFYDEMTNSGKYPMRISYNSNELRGIDKEFWKKKIGLLARSKNRMTRVTRMMKAYYNNMFTKEFVDECISKMIQKAFEYTISDEVVAWDGRKYKYLQAAGTFWSDVNQSEVDGRLENILDILNHEPPKTLTELITVYETIKKDLITEESKHLIDEYSKVIRSLKDYGNKTNNTEEDTQQVHLSFE